MVREEWRVETASNQRRIKQQCLGAGDIVGSCWPHIIERARCGCEPAEAGASVQEHYCRRLPGLERLLAGPGDCAHSCFKLEGRLSQGPPLPLPPPPPFPAAAGQRVCRAGPPQGPLPRRVCRRRAR